MSKQVLIIFFFLFSHQFSFTQMALTYVMDQTVTAVNDDEVPSSQVQHLRNLLFGLKR